MNKESQKTSAFSARIEGRVQGVGFRYTCVNEARRLGLVGWVRNTPQGDVEVLAEGKTEQLDILLEWLRRGPSSARVDRVCHDPYPPSGQYREFRII